MGEQLGGGAFLGCRGKLLTWFDGGCRPGWGPALAAAATVGSSSMATRYERRLQLRSSSRTSNSTDDHY